MRGCPRCPHGPPFQLQSSLPASLAPRGTSPGRSTRHQWDHESRRWPRGCTGQVQPRTGSKCCLRTPWWGQDTSTHQMAAPPCRATPSEQSGTGGQERLHERARLLLCSAPAPQGSLPLLPTSLSWERSRSVCLSTPLCWCPQSCLKREGSNASGMCRSPFTSCSDSRRGAMSPQQRREQSSRDGARPWGAPSCPGHASPSWPGLLLLCWDPAAAPRPVWWERERPWWGWVQERG